MEFYRTRARNYSDETIHLDLTQNWGIFEKFAKPQARVLDAGCGAGRDLKALGDRGFEMVGVDLSLPLCRLAAAHSNRTVICGNLLSLPFPNATFDAVWAAASLVHFTDEQLDLAVEEIRRVLRQDGVLVTSLKSGRGHERIPDGRWFNFVEQNRWNARLVSNKLTPVLTQPEEGKPWLLSVSRTVP